MTKTTTNVFVAHMANSLEYALEHTIENTPSFQLFASMLENKNTWLFTNNVSIDAAEVQEVVAYNKKIQRVLNFSSPGVFTLAENIFDSEAYAGLYNIFCEIANNNLQSFDDIDDNTIYKELYPHVSDIPGLEIQVGELRLQDGANREYMLAMYEEAGHFVAIDVHKHLTLSPKAIFVKHKYAEPLDF